MSEKSNQTAIDPFKEVFDRYLAGLMQWSVQGSNLRPPVNGTSADVGKTPPSPYAQPLKSPLSPRKDGETASASGNETAILPRPELSVPPSVYERESFRCVVAAWAWIV